MNPMTNVKNIKKLSDQELKTNFKSSWHDQYKDSAWIFVGGLPYDLTEGDIICVFSQYGEVVNINLIRDKQTGKQKGFCFLCYEDQRSTVLAVDNLNGIKILGRTVRVDHVADYKVPKEHKNMDEDVKKIHMEGCAPELIKEQNTPSSSTILIKDESPEKKVKVKKEKKHKSKKKKSKKSRKRKNSTSSDSSEDSSSEEDTDDNRKKSNKNNK